MIRTLNTQIRSSLRELDPKVQFFVLCVHDWLAFLSGESYLWSDYGSSLFKVVRERVSTTPSQITHWLAGVMGSDCDHRSLLYRHYLLHDVVRAEIDPQISFLPFYQLIASTLTREIVFSPLPSTEAWAGIEHGPNPINRLRQKQRMLLSDLSHLAMREHVHRDQTLDDHGTLTSFSLLYGSYLIYVILIFENTTTPQAVLTDLINAVHDTLSHLKGAFCHASDHWHEADVR